MDAELEPPATELLHWGLGEEFEEPTALFEVNTGALWWVAAEDASDALRFVKEDGEDEAIAQESGVEGIVTTVTSLTLERANELRFFGRGGECRMSTEYNRDPSPRLIACSEW